MCMAVGVDDAPVGVQVRNEQVVIGLAGLVAACRSTTIGNCHGLRRQIFNHGLWRRLFSKGDAHPDWRTMLIPIEGSKARQGSVGLATREYRHHLVLHR